LRCISLCRLLRLPALAMAVLRAAMMSAMGGSVRSGRMLDERRTPALPAGVLCSRGD
jgi:hypothetical protein